LPLGAWGKRFWRFNDMKEALTVTHTPGSMSFRVTSEESPGDEYLVDMGALDGNGFCTCRDFQCRCEPRFVATRKIVHYGRAGRSQCKHLNAVLVHLGQMVAVDAAKRYSAQDSYQHHHD
jgi:hypothetical protein